MIKTEFYRTREDGVNLIHTYSTTNHRIIQTDTEILYDEAIDIENTSHTYEESDQLIELETTDNEPLNILLGNIP